MLLYWPRGYNTATHVLAFGLLLVVLGTADAHAQGLPSGGSSGPGSVGPATSGLGTGRLGPFGSSSGVFGSDGVDTSLNRLLSGRATDFGLAPGLQTLRYPVASSFYSSLTDAIGVPPAGAFLPVPPFPTAPEDPPVPDWINPIQIPASPGDTSNVVRTRAFELGMGDTYEARALKRLLRRNDTDEEQIDACAKAYSKLIPQGAPDPWVALTDGCCAAGDTCAQRQEDYDRACLGRLSDADAGAQTLWQQEHRDAAQTIERAAGVLVVKGSEGSAIVCSGAFVAPNYILTARHCVFRRGDEPELRDPETLEFAPLAMDLDSYRIEEIVHPRGIDEDWFYDDKTEIDYVFLRTSQPHPAPMEPAMSGPQLFQGLILLSYQRNIRRSSEPLSCNPEWWSQAAGQAYVDDQSWRKHMRYDAGAACMVTEIGGGCVAHACQTNVASSGAPLAAIDTVTGDLSVVGVHVREGYFNVASGGCADLLSRGAPNLGAVVRPEDWAQVRSDAP